MRRLRRLLAAARTGGLALWMPTAFRDGTMKPAAQMPIEALAPEAIDRIERTAADLRYAMRLLYHTLHTLEQMDLMEPDSFMVEQALSFLRLAPEHLPAAWQDVEREVAAKAERGRELIEQDG